MRLKNLALLLILGTMLCGIAHADWMDNTTLYNTAKNITVQVDINTSFSNLTDDSSGIFITDVVYTDGATFSFTSLNFTTANANVTKLPYINSTLSDATNWYIQCQTMPAGTYTFTGTYTVSKCNIDYIELTDQSGSVTSQTAGWTCDDTALELTVEQSIVCPTTTYNEFLIGYRSTDSSSGDTSGDSDDSSSSTTTTGGTTDSDSDSSDTSLDSDKPPTIGEGEVDLTGSSTAVGDSGEDTSAFSSTGGLALWGGIVFAIIILFLIAAGFVFMLMG